MEIRRTLPQDVKEIAEAERLIFSDPWSEADILSLVTAEGGMCFSAISDGRVAAYVIGRIIPPEAEIYRFATLPEKRRRGIAYRLLDYLVKTERGEGLENLFLEVREQNEPARKLYMSYGFREIGMRKNYYKKPDDNAIIMLYSNEADL